MCSPRRRWSIWPIDCCKSIPACRWRRRRHERRPSSRGARRCLCRAGSRATCAAASRPRARHLLRSVLAQPVHPRSQRSHIGQLSHQVRRFRAPRSRVRSPPPAQDLHLAVQADRRRSSPGVGRRPQGLGKVEAGAAHGAQAEAQGQEGERAYPPQPCARCLTDAPLCRPVTSRARTRPSRQLRPRRPRRCGLAPLTPRFGPTRAVSEH
jgi:hypothetical protein